MKPIISIAFIVLMNLGYVLQSVSQTSLKDSEKTQSYILNSLYKLDKKYISQIDVAIATEVQVGSEPLLTENRMRTMIISLLTEDGVADNDPFKLNFTYFQENSSGELSEPEYDMQLDTRIAGANGHIENGNLSVESVCGVEPRYLNDIQNVLKPVFELANIHFPKEAMIVGDSFQNRFAVNYPLGELGTVETKQDMVITLMSVENNIASLTVKVVVSGVFLSEGVSYPVAGNGIIKLTLDIANQYITTYSKSQTDVITFKSEGNNITVRSTEISSNSTSIE